MLPEYVTLVQWSVSIDGDPYEEPRVQYAPGYGMVCSGRTTNGNWYLAAEWMLGELALRAGLYNREGFGRMVVHTATVPPEILAAATRYAEAHAADGKQIVRDVIAVLEQMLIDLGFEYDRRRQHYFKPALPPTPENPGPEPPAREAPMPEPLFLTIDDLATGRRYPIVVAQIDKPPHLPKGWYWRPRPEPQDGVVRTDFTGWTGLSSTAGKCIEHAWSICTDGFAREGKTVRPVEVLVEDT